MWLEFAFPSMEAFCNSASVWMCVPLCRHVHIPAGVMKGVKEFEKLENTKIRDMVFPFSNRSHSSQDFT